MKTLRRISILAAIAVVAAVPGWTKEFSWSADRQRAVLAEGREYTRLTGNARIVSQSMVIEAHEIELTGKDFRYAFCKGDVRVSDEQRGILLHTSSLFYDREEEITRVNGYAEMQDLKNEVVVKGGYFEYFGKEETAVIQIGVRILRVTDDEELACRAEFARYRRDDQILELSGMPKVTRNEDVYEAARIVINLDTDEITLEGRVSGTIAEKKEKSAPVMPEQGQ